MMNRAGVHADQPNRIVSFHNDWALLRSSGVFRTQMFFAKTYHEQSRHEDDKAPGNVWRLLMFLKIEFRQKYGHFKICYSSYLLT